MDGFPRSHDWEAKTAKFGRSDPQSPQFLLFHGAPKLFFPECSGRSIFGSFDFLVSQQNLSSAQLEERTRGVATEALKAREPESLQIAAIKP